MTQENTTDKKKVMLIVWKWGELTHVNERTFSEKEFNAHQADISKGDGIFYKEYPAESSDLRPNACVVAATIYKATEQTKALLYKLIDLYAKVEHELVILLHRSNMYEDIDVDAILNHFEDRVSKCFLFADGRDFIYFKTQRSGILDDIGDFMCGPIQGTKEIVATIENGVVKQPYFDRVWEYYQSEFETKVFQLKEELLGQWFPFMLPDQPIEIKRTDLIKAVKAADDRALYFRLKSFNAQYDELKSLDIDTEYERYDELENEQKAIESLEKSTGESYFFDDCIKNINHHKNNNRAFVADAYEAVKESLQDIVFNDSKECVQKTELLELADRFNYLVKVIPGELD